MADYKRFGQIVNAECYLEDNSLVGIVKEFKIPKIEWKTVDIETLGQVAVYKAPTRVMEALTGSMTFQFVEPEISAQIYNPTKTMQFQLHQYVDINVPAGVDLEGSYTLVTLVSLRFYSAEFGGTKLGDLEEQETEFTCSRLVQRVHDSDASLLEVDVFSNSVRNTSGEFWRR